MSPRRTDVPAPDVEQGQVGHSDVDQEPETGRLHARGGLYLEPTIFDVAGPDSVLMWEEIFGSVAAVTTVSSNETAIRVANNTPYGLAASVFSGNMREALRGARDIRAGTVTVNCYGEDDISTPFGGYKQSGFGGRDNSVYAHEQYTELKTIWIDVSDRVLEESIDWSWS